MVILLQKGKHHDYNYKFIIIMTIIIIIIIIVVIIIVIIIIIIIIIISIVSVWRYRCKNREVLQMNVRFSAFPRFAQLAKCTDQRFGISDDRKDVLETETCLGVSLGCCKVWSFSIPDVFCAHHNHA